jgi:hypothetical protein
MCKCRDVACRVSKTNKTIEGFSIVLFIIRIFGKKAINILETVWKNLFILQINVLLCGLLFGDFKLPETSIKIIHQIIE